MTSEAEIYILLILFFWGGFCHAELVEGSSRYKIRSFDVAQDDKQGITFI
jgi:hypothetical protein